MAATVGISGFSVYVPPHRVNLRDWCEWTDSNWDKVSAVVGRSFRVKGPGQSLYTMAASAVLRLIESYDIDPSSVGMLILGTESSTDNAAGAVILRGMIDEGLQQKGLPPLARDMEVPEIKHACLGGMYGLKQAARYLHVDGAGRKAIVVAADIAEYERGSTGEPTQGAGAVAMLVEEDPKLLAIDVRHSGSASRYRGPDFRKPFQRFMEPEYTASVNRVHDFPVFNGKYSTACYLDEVLAALDAMRAKLPESERDTLSANVDRVFFHRPYRKIPITAWAMSTLVEMSRTEEKKAELAELCTAADVELDTVLAELDRPRDLFAATKEGRLDDDPFPCTMRVLRAFRSQERHRELVDEKLALGSDPMMELGNLYTASLPAWLAAALEEAVEQGNAGRSWLLVGYGSGDAAEAIPVSVVEGFEEAARRIRFAESLEGALDLTREQYEAIHDGIDVEVADVIKNAFVVDRVGGMNGTGFDDVGIEYYRYVP